MLTSMFRKNFPDRLKELMDNSGMTQRELARRLASSNSTVSRWIKGDICSINTDMLFSLCDIFDVDPLYFCGK